MTAANGIAMAVEQFYEERKQGDLLPFCWRNQDCGSCLRAADFCSWCAFVCTGGFSSDIYIALAQIIYIYIYPSFSARDAFHV